MRNLFWACALASCLCAACTKAPSSNDAPANDTKQTDTNEIAISEGEVVLSTEHLKLTTVDYEQCLLVHRLNGRTYSQRALANPRFQHDEVQRCFQTAMMRKYALENKLEITPSERQKVLSSAFQNLGVQSEEALTTTLGIQPGALENLLFLAALPAIIQRHLIKILPDDAAQKMFEQDYRLYQADLLIFNNEPTVEEVAEYLKKNDQAVALWVNSHPEALNSPPKANFVRFGYPKSATQAAQSLKTLAAQNGLQPAIDKCLQDAENGCKILNDKEHLHEVVREENTAWAFTLSVGSVPEVISTEDSNEVWILNNFVPPQKRSLKDPGVQMEIGKKIMVQTVAAPHILEAIKPAIETEDPDLDKIAADNRGQHLTISDKKGFELAGTPGFESPKLRQIVSTVTDNETGLFSNPVVDREKIYVFRINSLYIPTEEDFKQVQSNWREMKAGDTHYDLVNTWLENVMPHMTTLNIKPLQNKYGSLRNDGIIH